MNVQKMEFSTAPSTINSYLRALKNRPGLKVGESLPAIEATAKSIQTDKKKLQAYCQVCEYTLTDNLPITYPHILSNSLQLALLTSPGFPLKLLGLVYIRNQIIQHRPIHCQEVLSFTCKIGDSRTTDKGLEFDCLTYCYSSDELIWENISTYLVRKKNKQKSQPKALEKINPDHTCLWQVPKNIGKRYGKISGDLNPIHMNKWLAKLFGFKRAIAHGMWTLARSVVEMDKVYSENTAKSLEVDFKVPLFIPASVQFSTVKIDNIVEFRLLDKNGEKPHLLGKYHLL